MSVVVAPTVVSAADGGAMMLGACEGEMEEGICVGGRVDAREGGGVLVGSLVGLGDGGLGGAQFTRIRLKRSMCPSLRRRSSFDSTSNSRRMVMSVVVKSLDFGIRSRVMRKQCFVSARMILSPLSQRAPARREGRVMRSVVVLAMYLIPGYS